MASWWGSDTIKNDLNKEVKHVDMSIKIGAKIKSRIIDMDFDK